MGSSRAEEADARARVLLAPGLQVSREIVPLPVLRRLARVEDPFLRRGQRWEVFARHLHFDVAVHLLLPWVALDDLQKAIHDSHTKRELCSVLRRCGAALADELAVESASVRGPAWCTLSVSMEGKG